MPCLETVRCLILWHIKVDRCVEPLYLSGMQSDQTLDAKGLLCPLPVLKTRKRLQAMDTGQVLRVEADDPAAVVDVPHFCAQSGHQLIEATMGSKAQVYLIRKLN